MVEHASFTEPKILHCGKEVRGQGSQGTNWVLLEWFREGNKETRK
jgi:hypothetical protein